MSKNQNIRLLQRDEIDAGQWDSTIEISVDGRIYATTQFLDLMAPGWQGLVLEEYQAVMPLPVRRKYGISYIYQPAFCQQLGVFSRFELNKKTVTDFLDTVQEKFQYAEINGHSGMSSFELPDQFRKNFLLPLNRPYPELDKQFSRSAKRNIQKAVEEGITIQEIPDPAQIILLHRKRYGNQLADNADLAAIQKLFENAISRGSGFCFYANDRGGHTIGSSGYLLYKDRLTFLINGNLQAGLDSGATHLLKQYVIQKFAGKDLLMDFEGSDTPSFARFYQQYGAMATDNYPFYKFNKLPMPIRWLK